MIPPNTGEPPPDLYAPLKRMRVAIVVGVVTGLVYGICTRFIANGGSSGRYDYLKEVAFRYAFIVDQVQTPHP